MSQYIIIVVLHDTYFLRMHRRVNLMLTNDVNTTLDTKFLVTMKGKVVQLRKV